METIVQNLIKNEKYGFFQISPTPDEKLIERFYREEFYSSQYEGYNDSSLESQSSDKDFLVGCWNDNLNISAKIMGKTIDEINLLDIGCGWGLALEYYTKKYKLECMGIDPSPEAITSLQSRGVQAGVLNFESFNSDTEDKFSVITLLNVLEHVRDPEFVIREIYRKFIDESGVLVIDVPNEFNLLQVAARDKFDLNDWWVCPPGHLNYFNLNTLSSLLENNGFKVIEAISSFPLEMFMLMGDNYVSNHLLGKTCHKKRVEFETTLRSQGKTHELLRLYSSFARLGIGRQIKVFAVKQ